jgi:PAS domain S-box-containing protein
MATRVSMRVSGGLARPVLVAIVAGVIATALIVIGIHLSHRFFLHLMGDQLSNVASDIASRVDADAHARIQKPSDISSQSYAKVSDVLEFEQRIKKGIASVYTLRIEDGQVRFIVVPPMDADRDGKVSGELEERQPVGTPYGQPADPEMVGAAILGRVTPGKRITKDRWGIWLSGCAPLVTSEGKLDAALCVDQNARPILSHMYKMDVVVIVGVALVCLAAALAAIVHFDAKMQRIRRQTAERGRAAILRLFQAVFDNVPNVPMHVLDRMGRISFFNRAAEVEFGMGSEEIVGKEASSFLADRADADGLRRCLEEAWQSKGPVGPRCWKVKRRGGATMEMSCMFIPVVYNEEVMEVICMSVEDRGDERRG